MKAFKFNQVDKNLNIIHLPDLEVPCHDGEMAPRFNGRTTKDEFMSKDLFSKDFVIVESDEGTDT